MDNTIFLNELKKGKLLGPVLSQTEVDGCNIIVKAAISVHWPIAYTSYGLATAYHETAHTMQPIHEQGSSAYFTRMYDITGNRPETAKKNGNTKPGDGIKYYGRGYVQLTWKNNYIRAESKCGIPGLAANPDLAMVPVNAAKIMISGMTDGWLTGKSCSSYLPSDKPGSMAAFTSARPIINSHDDDALIASYAMQFQNALISAKY